jgi:electron transport complex protein RnfC
LSCIECGCCDFVCPSHIPLVDWFRFGKGELRKRSIEKQASNLARKRFEDRDARLLRNKLERTEKMTHRKQMLKDKTLQQDRIRASIDRATTRAKGEMGIPESGQTDGKSDDT